MLAENTRNARGKHVKSTWETRGKHAATLVKSRLWSCRRISVKYAFLENHVAHVQRERDAPERSVGNVQVLVERALVERTAILPPTTFCLRPSF